MILWIEDTHFLNPQKNYQSYSCKHLWLHNLIRCYLIKGKYENNCAERLRKEGFLAIYNGNAYLNASPATPNTLRFIQKLSRMQKNREVSCAFYGLNYAPTIFHKKILQERNIQHRINFRISQFSRREKPYVHDFICMYLFP